MRNAARYNRAARFERIDPGALDRLGNQIENSWSVFFDAQINLRETPGKERVAAGRLEAPVTATLRLKTSLSGPAHALTPSDRVVIDGIIWNILSSPIDPTGKRSEIEIIIQRGSV